MKNILPEDLTLMLQKSRVLLVRSRPSGEIQGVKGEAVIAYREPLTMRLRRTGSGDAAPSACPPFVWRGFPEG